ncbi:MAG: saccharopine dehydrogenase C-terminal domain-containing protein [Bacteroidales bacterium]
MVENYTGQTSIGCRIRGLKGVRKKPIMSIITAVMKRPFGRQGHRELSYTTGVPAAIGAMMYLKGLWKKPGVFNVEEFDPDPFMEQLNKLGLPWHEIHDGDLEL